MSKIKFKRTVLRTITHLQDYGYYPSTSQPAPEIVRFEKELIPGVRCVIEFHILQFYVPPEREFDVGLFRTRLPSFPVNESRYATLVAPLQGLMQFVYGRDDVPTNGQSWVFTDEQSLSAQLLEAQTVLVEYAIKWLEDPFSTTSWYKGSSIASSSTSL